MTGIAFKPLLALFSGGSCPVAVYRSPSCGLKFLLDCK